MRQEIANQITQLMLEYQSRLNASTLLVQEECTDEEFQRYRRAVGRATDFMFIEISRALDGDEACAPSRDRASLASVVSVDRVSSPPDSRRVSSPPDSRRASSF